MTYKTLDGLMRHLRGMGIYISGSREKKQLMTIGYFHGYKGYRFFKDPSNKLPFTSFKEVYAIVQYDSKLKALFYDKIMYIETAVKNIALECIIERAESENIQVIFDKLVSGYNNALADATETQRKKLQQNKLNLQVKVQNYLNHAYKSNNQKIVHYYHNYDNIPLWALFEIMMLGDFAFY